MADVLPGYDWSVSAGRYRAQATGRFVARRDILNLLGNQVTRGENHLHNITTAFHEGRMSASVWSEQMRTEIKRMYLQNSAIGAGGFDRLDQRSYGRIGGSLRAEYARIEQFARDMQDGKVTLPQALARVDGYVGGARRQYWHEERKNAGGEEGMTAIERRLLDPGARHCRDCPGYYQEGWQVAGVLPVPGEACQCNNHCRCSIDRRNVPTSELGEWIGTKR